MSIGDQKGAELLKNKGSLFYSIFILLAIVSSAIIVFFSSWLYVVTTSNIEEEFSNSRTHSLEQTISTLESELQNIEYSFNAYSTTSTYERVIESPLSARNYDLYKEIVTQLNYFTTPNLQHTAYSLISLDQSWMVNDNRLIQLSNEELEEIKSYYLESNPSDLFWDSGADGMSVITLLPIFSQEKTGIGIANVSNEDISGIIQNRNIHFPIIILDQDADVLYSTGDKKDDIIRQIQTFDFTEITDSKESNGEIRVDDHEAAPFTLFYNESSHNNLIYITALFDSEVNESLTPTMLGFMVLGFLLILFSFVLSWVVSNHLTKPLRELKNEIIDSDPNLKTRNDFDYLRNSFKTIISQKESLESVLELEKPALKRQFVLNALLGRNTIEELNDKSQTYDFPLDAPSKYYVLVAQLDERVSNETPIRLFKLLHIIEEVIPANSQLTPVVMSEENVATIITFSEETMDIDKKIIEFSEAVIALAEESDLLVSIGISSEYYEFEESRESYKKAVRSLSYKLLLGNQSIISFEDVKSINTMAYTDKDLSDLKEVIFKAIQLGNLEDAKKNTNLFLASLYRNSDTPSAIEFGLLRFFIKISELDRSFETGVITRKLTEKFYNNLLFHRNIIEIEDIINRDILVPMTLEMEERTTEQFQQLSNQIKEIIDNRYEEDISLETISDELNYNPNYISSIFKKESGITFSDYLLEVRFDKAKDLLINTDLTVKEIAERLKYSNSQNFIRSFKKRESITPGRFRQEHKVT